MKNPLVELSEEDLEVLAIAGVANDELLQERMPFAGGIAHRRDMPRVVALALRFHDGVKAGVFTCHECGSDVHSPLLLEQSRAILAHRPFVVEDYNAEKERVLIAHLEDGCAFTLLARVTNTRRAAGLPIAPASSPR